MAPPPGDGRARRARDPETVVALLKGANVGGHRSFRPSAIARELHHLDVVNVGAAGTFVVRNPIAGDDLRAQIAERLPFPTEIMICSGSDVLQLTARDPFAGLGEEPDVVRFVSLLAEGRPRRPALPLELPGEGEWGLTALERRGRFVLGLHRRNMKAIGHLSRLEKLFGRPMTTRSWGTILTVGKVLRG